MSDFIFAKATTMLPFHGSTDAVAKLHFGAPRNETITGERHIITKTRHLQYRFYAHLHPYVQELGKRLIEKSVDGLQAADTEYEAGGMGVFHTLPFSIIVALPKDLALNIPKPGESGKIETITLVGSIKVTIPDGTRIKLPDSTEATLPGLVIARESARGTRLVLSDGTILDLDVGAPVSISSLTKVILPEAIVIKGGDGKLRRLTESIIVDIPIGTNVLLLGGKPRPKLFSEIFNTTRYAPTDLVQRPYPVRDLDFTSSGAYSAYNWELFYHIPLTVAVHLSKNQRYEEAQKWFHYIFDPTDDSEGATPERFWKVKPFQFTEVKKIEDILVNLSSGLDANLKQDTVNSIGAWKDAPFRPHLVARYRQTAFMLKAVMAYLDNLVAWGDDLFRQDTGESVNEATQIYVLASLILGVRPQAVPKKGTLAPLTYASRRGKWDEFDNTLEKLESEALFDLAPFPMSSGNNDQFATLRSIGTSLYFCVPRNDKLISYWDTVADRLFKIRNSLNLQGIFRQLPLFEPPIDPALLARATASGLDVSAVIAGLNQPLPLVRFQVLIQKATEICQEVKSLGGNLLSAMEKEDNEALAILRAKHEKAILGLAEIVKYAHWQETIKNREGIEVSLSNAVQRYVYFERQLGKEENDISVPQLDAIDTESFTKFRYKSIEQDVSRRPVGVDIASDLDNAGGKIVSRYEAEELSSSGTARNIHIAVRDIRLGAQGLGLIPDFGAALHFWGIGGRADLIGGTKLSHVASLAADIAAAVADDYSFGAGQAAKIGGFSRREQDWAFQSATIAGEINQMFKQLRASQIREYISEKEWHNHQKQMEHSAEIENFLTNEKTGKKTNQALYSWMKREVRGMYGQVFQFAFDVAKKAERALQHELGNSEVTYIQYGYMAGKEGLLAGEKLHFDLKRMEMAYHELNKREYELTKHISLMQVNPTAILQLRKTGSCAVVLPEELFDMDGPGHYFRRIKNVSISIPCVAGPYTSVNCTLVLTKSSIRTKTGVDGGYARLGSEDSRFSDHFGSTQAIVTSNAQNDSGLFETNLRDERYLPFEGSGAISEWQLELPAKVKQFDYDTISDVILHMRYTAREAGGLLRQKAGENLETSIAEAQATGSVRFFSMRHEFPTEWAKFLSQVPLAGQQFELNVQLREEHFPFWSKGRLKEVANLVIFAECKETAPLSQIFITKTIDATGKKDLLVKNKAFGDRLLIGKLINIGIPITPASPVGILKLYLDSNALVDLQIAIAWKG